MFTGRLFKFKRNCFDGVLLPRRNKARRPRCFGRFRGSDGLSVQVELRSSARVPYPDIRPFAINDSCRSRAVAAGARSMTAVVATPRNRSPRAKVWKRRTTVTARRSGGGLLSDPKAGVDPALRAPPHAPMQSLVPPLRCRAKTGTPEVGRDRAGNRQLRRETAARSVA